MYVTNEQNSQISSDLITSQIDVVADLPVGENLQNSWFTSAGLFSLEKPISMTENKAFTLWSEIQYRLFQTGTCEFIMTVVHF